MPPLLWAKPSRAPDATSMGKGQPSSCEYEGSGLHLVHLNVMPFDTATAGMYKAMCAEEVEGRADRPRGRDVLV